MKNGTITVGILIGNVFSPHTDNLLNGLIHYATASDVQTLFFMGAHANCFDELYYFENENKKEKYLFQFNAVFDYAKLGKLDVLIIAYSTFYLYMEESKDEFFYRFKDINIPIIIVGDEYQDYTSVISDNYDGIRKCMEHLIDHHGCKRIAYLSGPQKNNKDANERLEAYIQIMNERHFKIEKDMIQYGDYSANSATLFGKILDTYPDIEAVVCANDTMALAGYEECQKRGLIPGTDIAITGFDDIVEAKSASPALTTIEQNAYDLGYLAMKKAIELCGNGEFSHMKVPVYFKHRESCGSEKKMEEAIYDLSDSNVCEKIAKQCSEDILKKVFLYKMSFLEDQEIRNVLYSVFFHIAYVYFREDDVEYDIEFIDASLRTLIYSEKLSIHKFITGVYKEITTIIFLNNNHEKQRELSSLLLHIFDYIQNITFIESNGKRDTLQRNIWTTPFITREMIGNLDDSDRMYDCLMERIKFMQINNAYLFLMDEPKINDKISDWNCPKELHLVAKIENGFISQVHKEEILDKKHGFVDIISWSGCNNMAVYSLFSGRFTYGILVCEMTVDNITSMYSASLHIGSAMQFIELTKNQRTIRAELELAMTALKNKNDILNMISEKDELTGLYNRRGFLENAMAMMNRAKNCYVLCIYADLDHLKQINDQFGHQEGDFAIKKAGEYLQSSLRSTDVIGRIGGDEYAAVAVVKNDHMAVEICDRILLSSKAFNQSSEKPYYVEVSIGYVLYKWSEDLELNQMLSAADLMLYESKAKRRKDARKVVEI